MQWVIAGVAAVIVAVLVGAMLWKVNGRNESVRAAPSGTTIATSSSATPTTVNPSSCGRRSAAPTPQTPAGWQTVPTPDGLAYDVPPGFTVEDCLTPVDWKTACPETSDHPFGACYERTLYGVTSLPDPACADGIPLVVTGIGAKYFVDSIDETVRQMASSFENVGLWPGAVPTVSSGAPRHFTVSGAPAVEVIVTVSGITDAACAAPKAVHAIVGTANPAQRGTALFVVSMEQGVASAPEIGMLDQIVDSLRRTN